MSMLQDAKERWSGTINELTIGAGPDDGGTRTSVVKVGGEKALPLADLDRDGRAEHDRRDHQPQRDEPPQPPGEPRRLGSGGPAAPARIHRGA